MTQHLAHDSLPANMPPVTQSVHSRARSPRSWSPGWLVVVKGLVGLLAVAVLLILGEHYLRESELEIRNANVAAMHALVDGRADQGGYVAAPVGKRQAIPSLEAVSSSDAAAAVVADQTLAATLSTQGEMYVDHGRWFTGAAAAIFLLLVRSLWGDVRRWLLRAAATSEAALPGATR